MSRVRAVLIGLLLAASVTQSLFFAWALVPDPEEEMYLYLGKLALTGRISLFQDELVGNRMPLPYYLAGLSQLVFPRSLVAGRLFSAALGLLCLVLVWRIATHLGGELAGILALLFAATQSLLIGYFDVVSYNSLVSFILLSALFLYLCSAWAYRRIAAITLVSLLFFARTTVMPLVPLALGYFLWTARDRSERILLLAIVAVPPVAFFATDVNHWKLLAYVPILDKLAGWFGFASNRGAAFETVNVAAGENPAKMAVLLFARWYRAWIIVAFAVLIISAVDVATRRTLRWLIGNRGVNIVAAVVLYLALWQLLIMGRWKLQLAVGYFPSFAVMAAICLGCWAAALMSASGRAPGLRAAGLLGLCVFFLLAPAQSRPPMLPLRVSWRDPPVTVLYRLASDLGRAIPPTAHIFHLGGPLGLYIAGLEPYLRQERDFATLAYPAGMANGANSGFWGQAEIVEWLSRDADYAVVVPARVAFYRKQPLNSTLHLIESLLAAHFTRVAVIERSTYLYEVYRRKR